MKNMEERLGELAAPVLQEMGMEMVDLELSRRGDRLWVRMFIDRADTMEGGITADELGRFNLEISRILDVEEPIPESYLLEVSSPGVNRRIRYLRDWKKFLGQTVNIKTTEKVGGRTRIKAKVTDADDQGIELEVEGEKTRIGHEQIKRATLEYEFDE